MTSMKRRRLELGWSQQALGYRAGLQAGEVSRIERRLAVPSDRQRSRIARALKIDAEEILTEVEAYEPTVAAR
jgi:transcriptional regulator with XRE-family HTH domain